MSNIKQDLSTYKEIKKVKNDFSREIKSVKSNITKNNFKEAKNGLKICDKYISDMETIINKLPDKSTVDFIKPLVPAILSFVTAVGVGLQFNNKLRDMAERQDKYDNVSRELRHEKIQLSSTERKIKKVSDDLDKLDITDKDPKEWWIYNRPIKANLERDYKDLNEECRRISFRIKLLESEKGRIEENIDKAEDDMKKLNGKHRAFGATTLGVGAVGTLISLKPLKSKAKAILNKCKKVLNDTRKYLDKVEKMSKAVKESFDEALDNIYDSFTEGTIDEFEYDTLIDHLLD